MISKQHFIQTINRLKAIYLTQSDLDDFFSQHHDIFGDSAIDLGVTSDLCVDLLEVIFNIYDPTNIHGSTLSWWIYDLNFGENFNQGDLTVPSLPKDHQYYEPDLSTPELLYEFLIFESTYEKE